MAKPQPWSVRIGANAELTLEQDGQTYSVTATCCFPWSHPDAYISLRDQKGTERAFILQLNALETSQRDLIATALGRRNFIPEITAIHSIRDDEELFVWHVTTAAGERTFLTQRREHLRQLRSGAVLVRDVANDVLRISDPKKLDRKSFGLIWMHLD